MTTDDTLRLARSIAEDMIIEASNVEFGDIGEVMEDNEVCARMDTDEFNAVQLLIDEQIRKADVAVSWPSENDPNGADGEGS